MVSRGEVEVSTDDAALYAKLAGEEVTVVAVDHLRLGPVERVPTVVRRASPPRPASVRAGLSWLALHP